MTNERLFEIREWSNHNPMVAELIAEIHRLSAELHARDTQIAALKKLSEPIQQSEAEAEFWRKAENRCERCGGIGNIASPQSTTGYFPCPNGCSRVFKAVAWEGL